MTTLQINGRRYGVIAEPCQTGRPIYLLCSARGVTYRTVRRQRQPSVMFLVPHEGRLPAPEVEDVFLTDADGQLRRIEP